MGEKSRRKGKKRKGGKTGRSSGIKPDQATKTLATTLLKTESSELKLLCQPLKVNDIL